MRDSLYADQFLFGIRRIMELNDNNATNYIIAYQNWEFDKIN
jgi:hypothetical protein